MIAFAFSLVCHLLSFYEVDDIKERMLVTVSKQHVEHDGKGHRFNRRPWSWRAISIYLSHDTVIAPDGQVQR